MSARHVYIHVPFCGRRCSYCDFSIAVRRQTPVSEYLNALAAELEMAPPGEIDTLYLGGGTPSRLGGDGVRRLLDLLRTRYTLARGAEVTLEANPEDVTPAAARAWLEAGVNRLSIGAQSFDDSALRWMHRLHGAEAIAWAVLAAREAGFANVSLDLIFALPASLGRDWSRDLEAALELSPDHVSLYGLTVEPATPLARWRARGSVVEGTEDAYEVEYLLAHETLASAAFRHYEVSNFSRPGFESRHNQAYWTLVAYNGHGPAAHRFDGRQRAWNEAAYGKWLALLRSGKDPTAGREVLDPEQQLLEGAYLSLRTAEGLLLESDRLSLARDWEAMGWARIEGRRVSLSPAGWLRLDALISVLTHHRSPCNV